MIDLNFYPVICVISGSGMHSGYVNTATPPCMHIKNTVPTRQVEGLFQTNLCGVVSAI